MTAIANFITKEKNRKTLALWQILITWFCRILVGGLFTFSGFVKGIDPWGTFYKMQDYVSVLGIPGVSDGIIIVLVFLLFSIEFLIGIFIITGSFRKSSPILAFLFMMFMLPLSLWIAIKNPVPDCGCFGDAWIISNWATFGKNIAITIASAWLLIYNKRVHWLITPALQWLGFTASAILILTIGIVGHIIQPIHDFRSFPIGSQLTIADINIDTPHFIFIYEKNGIQKEFKETDSIPDEEDGWIFIDRKEIKSTSSINKPKQNDFRIWSEDGEEDVTTEVLGAKDGGRLILCIPDISEVSIAPTWKIHALKEWADNHDVDFIAVVAGPQNSIENWKDLSLTDYPIYTAEDTAIKELVRGNPAIVYTLNGEIIWKSTLAVIPGEEFLESSEADSATKLYPNISDKTTGIVVVYIGIMLVLIGFSFMQKLAWRKLGRLLIRKSHKTNSIDDGMVHREE